ncbi:MFS general substrate transporter [Xylaria bambusicola]|uniref:MFS general substrate transporter n=1 Tax=Xylaria bambusicola TaxID=326684 RepID=UPI0020077B19|nr:MFS general substrate transporter [Xylaria bambusicola]KAI0522067.1 MFS general substrate transporter [Xylaria bambusicola]
MGHLVSFNAWGFRSRSNISWVGSVQIFLLFAIGASPGWALDAGRFRPVTFVVYIAHILGIFLTSISSKYWHVLLTQGFLVGIGNGLLFCLTISLVGTYTVRIFGVITIFASTLAFGLLKPRLPPRPSGSVVDWAAFNKPPYVLYCIGISLIFLGLYFAFYYIGAFARDIIGLTYTESINPILIINGVRYVGRNLPAIIADKYFRALNAIIPCAFGSGILLFGWIGVHDQRGQISFAVVYGIAASVVQSMFAIALSSLTTDLGKLGTRNGMCFAIISISTLIGPHIAGVLIDEAGGSYLHAQAYAVAAGSLVLMAARLYKTGPGLIAQA